MTVSSVTFSVDLVEEISHKFLINENLAGNVACPRSSQTRKYVDLTKMKTRFSHDKRETLTVSGYTWSLNNDHVSPYHIQHGSYLH